MTPQDRPGPQSDTPPGSARAVLYRHRFADAEYDEAKGTLTVAGREISVEPRPLRLLATLLHHVNEVVTKEELFQEVWEGRPTVDNVLASAVTKLRKALGEEAGARIVNIPRIGYRLLGPVERLTVGAVAAPPANLQEGQAVPGRDGYRLIRALGHTPRGNVWLARHDRLGNERVFKFAVDGDGLRALKREFTLNRVLRQEVGERPDFVPLLEANFNEPPFFLESDYRGPDLQAWAAAGGQLVAMPQAERLALFLQIARAVAAAHSVGVLHKDLKPANVLVSGGPGCWQACLIDFGSGRALDPKRLQALGITALGLTLTQGIDADSSGGTPLYLAPEVMAGQAPTTQSDLYALGLMLYQMLAGDLRRPLVTGWQQDVTDELLVKDITAATQGRPADRLPSVAELVVRLATLPDRRAAAIQLADEQQRSDRATRELQRRQARRPWLAGAWFSLAIGLAVSLGFFEQARRAAMRAEYEATRANSISNFLTQDALVTADVIRIGANKPVTIIELLQQASSRARARFKGQPLAEGAVRHHLARMFVRTASNSDADNEYVAAITLLAPLLPKDDPSLLAMRFERAHLMFAAPNLAPDAPSVYAEAVRDAGPKLLEGQNELAFLALRAQVELLDHQDQLQPATTAAGRLLSLAQALPDLDAGLRLDAHRTILQAYMRAGNQSMMEEVLRTVAQQAPEGDRDGLLTATYARAAVRVAETHIDAGRLREAEKTLVAARNRLLGAEGRSELHLGNVLNDLGLVYEQESELDNAAAAYSAALTSLRAALGDDHQYPRVCATNLAAIENGRGNHLSAYRILLQNQPWFKAHAKRGYYVPLEYGLAVALIGLGRHQEAMTVLNALPAPDDGKAQEPGMNSRLWMAQGWKGVAQLKLGLNTKGQEHIHSALKAVTSAGLPAWEISQLERAGSVTAR